MVLHRPVVSVLAVLFIALPLAGCDGLLKKIKGDKTGETTASGSGSEGEGEPAVGKAKFPLVGDPTHVLTKAFDVFIPEQGLALRGTFLINPEGIPGLRTPIMLSRSPLMTDVAAPALGNGMWAFGCVPQKVKQAP